MSATPISRLTKVWSELMTAASVTRSSVTPADLTITPRDRRFGRDEATPRWWHGGNPYASALYNALSATFPEGEAFFVESVRKHRDGVDARLAGEIKAFTTQEVIHSREHLAFNRRAADAGYDLVEARGAGPRAARADQVAAADRQPRRDHGARAFHRHPRARTARRPAPPRRCRRRDRRAVALARGRGNRA